MHTHDILIGLILLILACMTIKNSMTTMAPSFVAMYCGENKTGLHNGFKQDVQTCLLTKYVTNLLKFLYLLMQLKCKSNTVII